jgi:hypothetical protein
VLGFRPPHSWPGQNRSASEEPLHRTGEAPRNHRSGIQTISVLGVSRDERLRKPVTCAHRGGTLPRGAAPVRERGPVFPMDARGFRRGNRMRRSRGFGQVTRRPR